jgi:uncharacterized protein YndB with AHSA1/START domain
MNRVTISSTISAPVAKVWEYYTDPAHIVKWNFASDDWHCPHAESDLRAGGTFSARMEAKDGSAGFDFAGVYDEVVPGERIAYTFGDRHALITFAPEGEGTTVTISFDPETINPIERQRAGWSAIFENFKKECEAQRK